MPSQEKITIERSYPASADELWELWTTPKGIEAWWAPDGFTVEVSKLEVVPGGELRYAMIASAPAQIDFMQKAGMPLRTEASKTFTEVERGRRLGYISIVDYAPGVEPYEHETLVEFTPDGQGVKVVMTMESMHDEDWTQRLTAGRNDELDNLRKLIEVRGCQQPV